MRREYKDESGGDCGFLDWEDCLTEQQLLAAMKETFLAAEFAALAATGHSSLLPARVVMWLEVAAPYRRQGMGTKRMNEFIAESRSAGFVGIYLKAQYDFSAHWQEERDWKERFYESLGFVASRSNDAIRPLMYRNLVDEPRRS